jgi:mono/diheme cytochrome c family protein
MRHPQVPAARFAVVLLLAGVAWGDAPWRSEVAPLLQAHCVECHSGETPAGGLDVEAFSADLDDAEVRRRWIDLHDRVARGEMPPPSEELPDADAMQRFLRSLGSALTDADLAAREVHLRRLNRNEYEQTVRDLFGIFIDLGTVLPDDHVEQGFNTIGANQSVSAEQMLLYIEAADLVLDEVFGPAEPPQRINRTVNIRDLSTAETADRVEAEGVVLFSGAKSLPLYGVSVRGPAEYRVRIAARAVQTDRPIIMQVEGGVTGRIPGHVAAFVEVPPDETTVIELTDRAVEQDDTFAFKLVGGFPWWSVDADSYAGFGVWLGDVTIEGPLEPWPRPSRVTLLGQVDPSRGTLDDIREILSRVAGRAFRRDVAAEEVDPHLELARQALEAGQPWEAALRRGLKGVLCAPEFLFLDEGVANESAGATTIDDFALAARLSYFLWSSLPDDDLLALARRGELREPGVLRTQVERMLDDPKSQRFVESFTDQWLKLRDIDFTVPDVDLYPEYNPLLRRAMLDETRAFFREVLDRDLSVQSFLDSDFAMLNGPLAEFYGIAGVEGLEIRRVELPPDSLRGGVLTQASVLKVSADGTRTSPVLRGAWVLENLYGTPSPPPPPTVSAIEPDIRGATTIREQLALHRSHESCNRCHVRIDPPGFALEEFDVIGGERQWYRTAQGGEYVETPLHPQAPNHPVRYQRGPEVDASGTMPDGREFSGIREYKQCLLDDESALPLALTRLLMEYALGRTVGFSDRPEVERIVAATRSNNCGLRSIIHEVVQSPAFRQP